MFVKLLKPLSFLPAILMMYLIFTFSAQDGVTSSQLSYKVSYKVVEVGGELLGADFEPWEIDNLATRFHGVVRKLAHMTEYFCLAVAVAFPLYVYGLRGILLMIVAGFFCVAFACGDEYHQSYVAGRGPSTRDVMIDSFGVFWGIVLVRIVGWTGRKTIFRPFSKKKRKKGKDDMDGAYRQAGPYPGGYAGPAPGMRYPPAGAGYPNGQPHMNASGAAAGGYTGAPHGAGYLVGRAAANAPGYAAGSPDRQAPSHENVSYYPPRQTPYDAPAGQQQPYRQPAPGYYGQPVQQPYGYPPYQPQPEATSDRLSEDMSFKKLMHDLKEQKKEPKATAARAQKMPYEPRAKNVPHESDEPQA